MASLDETEVTILRVLASHERSSGQWLSRLDVSSRFSPPLDLRLTDVSLRHLKECGFVTGYVDPYQIDRYSLTDLGRQILSSLLKLRGDNEESLSRALTELSKPPASNVEYKPPSSSAATISQVKSAPTAADWDKSSAIGTWVTVGIGLLALLVAVWLDYN